MNLDRADRLLELARRARWDYPTSFGRPIKWGGAGTWTKVAEQDREHFVVAAGWLVRGGEKEKGIEMAARVWRLWVLAGDEEAGLRFLSHVLEQGPRRPTAWTASVLYGASLLALRLGQVKRSRSFAKRSFTMAKAAGDAEALTLANLALSRVALEERDYRRALEYARAARRHATPLPTEFDQAPLSLEASSARMLGDYDEAARLFRESVALNRRLANRRMVTAEFGNLGAVEIHRGDVAAAEDCFRESERAERPTPKEPYWWGMHLLDGAMVAFRKGRTSESRALLSKSKEAFRRAGLRLSPEDAFERDWLGRELRKVP